MHVRKELVARQRDVAGGDLGRGEDALRESARVGVEGVALRVVCLCCVGCVCGTGGAALAGRSKGAVGGGEGGGQAWRGGARSCVTDQEGGRARARARPLARTSISAARKSSWLYVLGG